MCVASKTQKNTQRTRSDGTAVATYLDYMHTLCRKKSTPQFCPYECKIVKSGDVIEVYRYVDLQFKKITEDVQKEANNKVSKLKSGQNEENANYQRSDRTVNRTKTRLKRLINANINQYAPYKDKFITLTFEKYLSRAEVIECFKRFNKRLKYYYGKYDYKYIAVIERGTSGTHRLHLHCLFFGLPYIPVGEFRKIWKYGNVDMEAIDEYNEVASYILKYIGKTLEDGSYIGKGQKFYITSQGLKKADEYYLSVDEMHKYIENHKQGKEIIMQTIFTSEHLGTFEYIKMRRPHPKDNALKNNDFEHDSNYQMMLADEKEAYEEFAYLFDGD